MNRLPWIASCWCILMMTSACNKEEPTPVGNANIELEYSVDGQLLQFDTIRYLNEAGNNYSVNSLEYYLSDFTFINSDEIIYKAPEIQYVNARSVSRNQFSLKNVPAGDYDCLELTIGLSPENNISNSLPDSIYNFNMFWPDVMGGGYHFMKLEGHYLDSTGNFTGYTMHLGVNGNAVRVKLCGLQIQVKENAPVTIRLNMNINEWYQNPSVYDFSIDGNYTMGIDSLMQKLSANGADVFSATVR